ncbi:MAG: hypothetical protein LBH01_11920 [Verrucomicrobiales bacterium]|jgi:hypothetical protein|nr:hypothetical protein [Verrucomicrobiales bacterium]
MAVTVAEYLGKRTDNDNDIVPVPNLEQKPDIACPFRCGNCLKAKKRQQPICSVRDSNGKLWIVCEHRLCATTPKAAAINEHQKKILRIVAQAIYGTVSDTDILFKREVPIPITDTSDYKADYVMWRTNPAASDRPAIVEMQGGGETAGTEKLTDHVKKWSQKMPPTNAYLRQEAKATPLITNAWRRQQEQFLVKGSVATLTGAKMVFCVGSSLYEYLIQRLTTVRLQDLSQANWSLALLPFVEDTDGTPPPCAPDSIQFEIDLSRARYTNYFSFIQALTNQGSPQPQVFTGEYNKLDGEKVQISS